MKTKESWVKEYKKLRRDCWDKDCIGCVKDDKRIIGFIRQLLTKQKAKWVEKGWQIGYKQCKESK